MNAAVLIACIVTTYYAVAYVIRVIRCARLLAADRIQTPRHTWVVHFVYGEHHVSAIWHDWRDARAAIQRAVATIERLAEEQKVTT